MPDSSFPNSGTPDSQEASRPDALGYFDLSISGRPVRVSLGRDWKFQCPDRPALAIAVQRDILPSGWEPWMGWPVREVLNRAADVFGAVAVVLDDEHPDDHEDGDIY